MAVVPRPLVAAGGRRSGARLTSLVLGPGEGVLRSVDVRLGAGVRLVAPRSGRLGTVTFVDARGSVLRRVPLRVSGRRGVRRSLSERSLRGTVTFGAPGRLRFGALPAGTAGLRVELSAPAVRLGACRAPGWTAASTPVGGGTPTVVRAARAC